MSTKNGKTTGKPSYTLRLAAEWRMLMRRLARIERVSEPQIVKLGIAAVAERHGIKAPADEVERK